MGQIIKDQKEINRKISYEDISSDLENNFELSYSIDVHEVDTNQVINNFLIRLDFFIESESLSENEVKIGHALHDLFSNYETIFLASSNNKFNKNIILLSLRDMTNLTTKEIRGSMKKFKSIYNDLLQEMLK